MPGHIQGVYVQNIVKLFIRITTGLLEKSDTNKIVEVCNLLLKKLPTFISSGHIEVQERASSAFVLIEMLRDHLAPSESVKNADILEIETNEGESVNGKVQEIPVGAIEIVQEMALLFAGDLNPVAPKAQRKVQLPEGLNLDEWINPPPDDSSSSSEDEQTDLFVGKHEKPSSDAQKPKVELTKEELHKVIIDYYYCKTYVEFCN